MRGWKRFFISPEHNPTENIDRANSIEGDVNAKLLIENAELKAKLEAKEIEFVNLKEDALNTDKASENWLQLARKQAMEIKRLRRVLCLAKAERAKEAKYLWHVYFRSPYLYYCSETGDRTTRKNPFKHLANKSYKEWVPFWGNIEEKYLKLAEKLK